MYLLFLKIYIMQSGSLSSTIMYGISVRVGTNVTVGTITTVLVGIGVFVLLGNIITVGVALGHGVALGTNTLVALTLVGQYVGGGSVGFGSYTCSLAHHANSKAAMITMIANHTRYLNLILLTLNNLLAHQVHFPLRLVYMQYRPDLKDSTVITHPHLRTDPRSLPDSYPVIDRGRHLTSFDELAPAQGLHAAPHFCKLYPGDHLRAETIPRDALLLDRDPVSQLSGLHHHTRSIQSSASAAMGMFFGMAPLVSTFSRFSYQ